MIHHSLLLNPCISLCPFVFNKLMLHCYTALCFPPSMEFVLGVAMLQTSPAHPLLFTATSKAIKVINFHKYSTWTWKECTSSNC